MRKRTILPAVGVLAVVASLTFGPAAPASPEITTAGTVVFVHDQEPPTSVAAGSTTTCSRPGS